MTDLVEAAASLPAEAPAPTNPLQAVLSDPARLAELDVEKLERLMEMQRTLDADDARRQFYAAFRDVQDAMWRVPKRGLNTSTRSRYALAEDVYAMLDPITTRHGFSRSFSTEASSLDNHIRFVLTVRHSAGHHETHRFDAPVDDVGMKGNPTKTRLHGMASSYTYVERHMVCKVFGVQTGEADDDGNAAAGVGPSAAPVSEREAADVQALIEETGADRARFLAYFGVDSIEALPASRLREAVAMLRRKRRAD